MNVIKHNKEAREIILSKLTATIKSCFDKGLSVNKEKLILAACSEFLISTRTAQEYLKVVSMRIPYKQVKVNGENVIVKQKSEKGDKFLQKSLK